MVCLITRLCGGCFSFSFPEFEAVSAAGGAADTISTALQEQVNDPAPAEIKALFSAAFAPHPISGPALTLRFLLWGGGGGTFGGAADLAAKGFP